jgi:hypothetical protein
MNISIVLAKCRRLMARMCGGSVSSRVGWRGVLRLTV